MKQVILFTFLLSAFFRLRRKKQDCFCNRSRKNNPFALCREPQPVCNRRLYHCPPAQSLGYDPILHTYVLVDKEKSLPADLPEGTLVRTPLSKAVVYSSVHCGLLDQIGALESIGGVCDLKYIKLPEVQDGCRTGSIADVGNGMNPDMEKIIDLHPDAIMLSPFENSGGYGRVEKLDIPIIECADYMETSALGRAEWMRFYGLLFGEAQKADSLFAEVEKNYNELKALVAPLSVRTERYQRTEKRFGMVCSGR